MKTLDQTELWINFDTEHTFNTKSNQELVAEILKKGYNTTQVLRISFGYKIAKNDNELDSCDGFISLSKELGTVHLGVSHISLIKAKEIFDILSNGTTTTSINQHNPTPSGCIPGLSTIFFIQQYLIQLFS